MQGHYTQIPNWSEGKRALYSISLHNRGKVGLDLIVWRIKRRQVSEVCIYVCVGFWVQLFLLDKTLFKVRVNAKVAQKVPN